MTEEELQLALAALGIEPKDEEIKEIIKPFARRGMTLTKFIEIASEKVVVHSYSNHPNIKNY